MKYIYLDFNDWSFFVYTGKCKSIYLGSFVLDTQRQRRTIQEIFKNPYKFLKASEDEVRIAKWIISRCPNKYKVKYL